VNFWWLFEPHFFRVYYFSSKQEACQKVLCEQEVNEIMPGCHPSYLKTVSQQVVSRIRIYSLRFLTPNTAFLVRIIQIYTNFGWLKWLITNNFCIYVILALQTKFYLNFELCECYQTNCLDYHRTIKNIILTPKSRNLKRKSLVHLFVWKPATVISCDWLAVPKKKAQNTKVCSKIILKILSINSFLISLEKCCVESWLHMNNQKLQLKSISNRLAVFKRQFS
jgi:hypothetical protein